MELNQTQVQQVKYAKIVGFNYVFLVVLFGAGSGMIAQIQGEGDAAAIAGKIAASAGMYRFALLLQLLASLGTVLLAFAQYVTLKPVNKELAQVAMYWRLGEAFIGAVYVGTCFIVVRMIVHLPELAPGNVIQYLTVNNQGILLSTYQLFFSIGSAIFFYLFLKSKYIPVVLSGIGVVASVIAFFVCICSLIMPESADKIQAGFAPVVLTEVVAGLWMIFRRIKVVAL